MNNTLMTPESAPRDLEQLTNQGPFIHRRLAEALEKLGFRCFTNEREKTAFVTASPGDRAQMLLGQLQAFDAARGGAPAVGQAPPQTQAAPPPTPPAAGAGRQPRTTAPIVNAGPTAGNGNGGAAGAAAAGTGNVVELLNVLKAVQAQLSAIDAGLKQANVAEGTLASELQSIKGMLAAMLKIQEVQIGLLSLFGQQVLGAPPEAFLESAITDGPAALQILEQLTGKG